VCVVSSVGISSDLLMNWDPNKFTLDPTLCSGGILVSVMSLENHRFVNFLNVYGPCSERLLFWDRLATKGLLVVENLMLAGELNFTTGADEVCGPMTHLDRHANYFIELIKDHSLVDLAPNVFVPMWKNGRVGGAGIAKRLDHILIAESLLNDDG